MELYIHGKKTRLNPSKIIGSGGEADVYQISKNEVAKIFKLPSHGDFIGNNIAQKEAKNRIQEHQKKLKAWPKDLPKNVIGPTGLITNAQGRIHGYSMKFLSDMEVLLKYGEKKYRETNNISHDNMKDIFCNLHTLIHGVHKQNVVIGDFNDLNVLVDNSMNTFLVDADSMQFGGFMSRVFTARFVDPLLCQTNVLAANLETPHNTNSDWYAYCVMLMQSLLYVGPYGGVHIPTNKGKKLKEWARIQQRMTVFHDEIRYPRPALHYSMLPDDLLDMFHKVFEKDMRSEFPRQLLENMNFTTCSTCNTVHARAVCPSCQPVSPQRVKEIITGNIEAFKVLDTSGRILYTTIQRGVPRYVYHENGAYYRDGAKKLIDGPANPSIQVRINKNATILSQKGHSIILDNDGSKKNFAHDLFQGRVSVIDSNHESIFTVQGDQLQSFKKNTLDYPTVRGNILPSQTLVWVGEKLGFVFSRAGGITRCYVFHSSGNTIGSEGNIGVISGQVVDATTVFSQDYVWFMLTTQQQGQRINTVYMFDAYGKLCSQAQSEENDSSWLGSIRGKCASGDLLFSPTDDGIVRVENESSLLRETKVFSQTTRFVDSSTKLLYGKDGIYTVSKNQIWRLQVK